jgi:hypothetical protein
MKALIVLAVAIVALAAIPLDYGFYNPTKGAAAPGRVDQPATTHEREMLPIVITAADVQRFKGKVTLTTLSELYGTKDSLPCSVKRTYNSDNLAAANWPIPVGSTATLCLN